MLQPGILVYTKNIIDVTDESVVGSRKMCEYHKKPGHTIRVFVFDRESR